MMYYGHGLGLGAGVTFGIAAVLIYLIVRCRATKAGKKALAISLFCAIMLIVAASEAARQRAAQRGYSQDWGKTASSAMFRSFQETNPDDASHSEGKTTSASVQVLTSDANEPTRTVKVESVQEETRNTAQSRSVTKNRARSRPTSIDDSRDQARGIRSPVLLVTRIGAFSVLLILAYLFLDAGRRQRYIWPRRIVVAAAFAAVCVFLWRIGPLM